MNNIHPEVQKRKIEDACKVLKLEPRHYTARELRNKMHEAQKILKRQCG